MVNVSKSELQQLKYMLKITARLIFYIHKKILLKSESFTSSTTALYKDALQEHAELRNSRDEVQAKSFTGLMLRIFLAKTCLDSNTENCDEYDKLIESMKPIPLDAFTHFKNDLIASIKLLHNKFIYAKKNEQLLKIVELAEALSPHSSKEEIGKIISFLNEFKGAQGEGIITQLAKAGGKATINPNSNAGPLQPDLKLPATTTATPTATQTATNPPMPDAATATAAVDAVDKVKAAADQAAAEKAAEKAAAEKAAAEKAAAEKAAVEKAAADKVAADKVAAEEKAAAEKATAEKAAVEKAAAEKAAAEKAAAEKAAAEKAVAEKLTAAQATAEKAAAQATAEKAAAEKAVADKLAAEKAVAELRIELGNANISKIELDTANKLLNQTKEEAEAAVRAAQEANGLAINKQREADAIKELLTSELAKAEQNLEQQKLDAQKQAETLRQKLDTSQKIIDRDLLIYIINLLKTIVKPITYNSEQTNIFEGRVRSFINNTSGNDNSRFVSLVDELTKQSRISLGEILKTIKIGTDNLNPPKYDNTNNARKYKKKVIIKILGLLKIHILIDELEKLLNVDEVNLDEVNLDSENKNIEAAITDIKDLTLNTDYDEIMFQNILSENGLPDSFVGLITTRFKAEATDKNKRAILLNKVNTIINPEKVPAVDAATDAVAHAVGSAINAVTQQRNHRGGYKGQRDSEVAFLKNQQNRIVRQSNRRGGKGGSNLKKTRKKKNKRLEE